MSGRLPKTSMERLRPLGHDGASSTNLYYRAEVCKEFEEWLASRRATDYRRVLTFGSFTEAHILICDLRKAYQTPERIATMRQVLQNKSKQDVQTANELGRFMFVEMSSELKMKSSTALKLEVDPYTLEDASVYAPELEWADDILQASYAIKNGELHRLQTEGEQVYQLWLEFNGMDDITPSGQRSGKLSPCTAPPGSTSDGP